MFTRYAIYFTPSGAFADAGAAWLGWDSSRRCAVGHPVVAGLDVAALTQRPRKYGFHGTIKAPFALAEGQTEADLRDSFRATCTASLPVTIPTLEVTTLGPFLALVPGEDSASLQGLAAKFVRDLDPFRAPLTADDVARRTQRYMTPQQVANLARWGYPHVMESFNFHMTLTGTVPRAELAGVTATVRSYFAPVLPAPFVIDALTLMGEREDGRFVALERCALGVQGACTLRSTP